MAKKKNEGYVTIHKSIQSWKFYHDNYALKVYQYLIINAAYQDMRYDKFLIKRGQWLGSRKKLAGLLEISRPTANKKIQLLLDNNDIQEIRVDQWKSIFTVVNYDKYQKKKLPSGANSGANSDANSGAKQIGTIKERENSPLTGVRSQPQIFYRDDEDYLQQSHISNRKLN